MCLLRLSALGDVTHVVPLVRTLQAARPDTPIHWIIDKVGHKLLDGLPEGAPVIIAGDFNDWKLRGNRTLRQQRDLHEAFERHHGMLARTYPARLPLLALDRIYLRNAESHAPKILSHKPWTHLSDHLPLAVEVRL